MDLVTSSYLAANTTTVSPPTQVPNYVGFICLAVSVLFFGSNFLPIKAFDTGDGMFFQLCLTTAIWTVGFVVNCIRGFPKFYPLPMLGGFLWSTGNLNTVIIIKLIGIGLGNLFWYLVTIHLKKFELLEYNLSIQIKGWAIARFGWFGVKPEVPSNVDLNYVGLVLAASSGLFYLFVQNESKKNDDESDQRSLVTNEVYEENEENLDAIVTIRTEEHGDKLMKFLDGLNPNAKRILGISLASISGVLYAFTFTPALYVQDNYENASQNALDYVFSLYSGIFISSITYFVIYCIVKKNKPNVQPQVILPALASGTMWGIANSSFFLANNALSQAVTFPIVSSGPSAIAALWGIILYKEIKGFRNFVILGIGFSLAVAGSILTGLSK